MSEHGIEEPIGNLKVLLGGPVAESKLYLEEAEEALTAMRSPEGGENRDIKMLVEEYKQALSAVGVAMDKIQDRENRKEVYVNTLRQLAGHQQILRAIRRRPPQDPLPLVDTARYSNIALQESIVKKLEEIDPTDTETITDSLACPRCNVIVVSLTTLRKDRIGLYGYDTPTTPNIDAFFQDSLVFTSTIAPTAWTLPNAVSFFTSLFPYSHGVVVREPPSVRVLYNTEVKTLAEILSEEGYKTAAFTGGGDYNRRYNGLDRGFDFYLDEINYDDFNIVDDLSLGGVILFYAPLQSFLGLATDWLAASAEDNFFLFLEGYDTHCPLNPHEPYASQYVKGLRSSIDFSYCHWTYGEEAPLQEGGVDYWNTKVVKEDGSLKEVSFSKADIDYMNALYDARVAEVDDRLGALFLKIKALGLEKNTIVILTSEHGEMLGEYGWFMRGGSLRGTTYEPALSFPLIIKHPHIKEPVIVDDIVQTVDLMPTLLAMLGIDDPQASIREGSVLNLLTAGTSTNPYGYAGAMFIPAAENREFSKANAQEVIRDTEWKLTKEILFEDSGLITDTVFYRLFNIAEDPQETTNKFESEPGIARKLKEKLEEWSERYYSSL